MRLDRWLLCGGLFAGLLAIVAGCGGGIEDDPILRLSAEESLQEGQRLMAAEKYAKARPYLLHAFEVAPNSADGREALLLVADSYFLDGGVLNLVQAESKYRDFLNRFPTSGKAPYAQYQLARSLAQQMEKPDRDQSKTEKALETYDELLSLYPTSEYAALAREEKEKVLENLAEHEWLVGNFYLRYRMPTAAVQRLEKLLKKYPSYSEMDKVLFHLGLAYRRSRRPGDQEKARDTFERLRADYPESHYVDEIPEPQAERTGK